MNKNKIQTHYKSLSNTNNFYPQKNFPNKNIQTIMDIFFSKLYEINHQNYSQVFVQLITPIYYGRKLVIKRRIMIIDISNSKG